MAFLVSYLSTLLSTVLTPLCQRNTYTLLNFGNFVEGTSNSSKPYVQLLSTTDPAQAHQDFVQSRLNGTDITGTSQYALLPASQAKKSPVPFGERVTHTEQKVIRYTPEIVCISVAVVLALAGYGTWVYIKRRRARRAAQQASNIRISIGKGYSSIQDPEPPIYLQNMESQASVGNKYGYSGYSGH